MIKTAACDISTADVQHDLKPLAQLLEAFRTEMAYGGSLPRTEHFLFERLLNQEAVVYLARQTSGEICGFIYLEAGHSLASLQSVWFVLALYVIPAFRHQGIATRLLKEASQLAQERGDSALIAFLPETATETAPLFSAVNFQKQPQGEAWMLSTAKTTDTSHE